MGKVEKIAKFTVFVHDVLSGPSATVVEVARASITSTSPSSFGLVRVLDDSMTVEPDPSSYELGRAQGIATSADKEESSLCMNIVFMFTGGEYKGGTLSIVGRRSLVYGDSEVPVVGGTGIFRGARGYAVANTYSEDAATGNYVMRYDMHVVYPAEE
ncbi:hypothetical protein C2S53_010342 [Perilla frutescens var. hirtella]|uniref:Dirigent protein n=1 Tax=Perilla frutescens var. hirtella TaxID=608512 RepID=A0AAD4P2J6_PERFH|nr:hypothetical protein C2S53_010342 [Perilla frutescens var. hirtella]